LAQRSSPHRLLWHPADHGTHCDGLACHNAL
jgi:hypothetical protein